MEKSWKVYYYLKKYNESFADLNKALEINFENLNALYFRGMVYREIKRFDESLMVVNKSLEIEMNRCNESLNDFNKSLKIKLRFAIALSNRRETYQLPFDEQKI